MAEKRPDGILNGESNSALAQRRPRVPLERCQECFPTRRVHSPAQQAHPGYMSAMGKRHYRLRTERAQAMSAAVALVVAAEQEGAVVVDAGNF